MEQQEIQQGVAEQIQKLFALAEGTTYQSEKETALKKAYSLMAKHNVSLTEEKKESDFVLFKYVGKNSQYLKYVNALINKFFSTRVVESTTRKGNKKNKEFHYIVHKDNYEHVLYIRDFLFNTFDKLYTEYKKEWKQVNSGRRIPSNLGPSFYYGLYIALKEKLEAEEKQQNEQTEISNALVVVNKELDQELRKRFPRVKGSRVNTSKTNNADGIASGYEKGKSVSF